MDFNEKIIYGGPVRLLKYDSEKNKIEIFFHNPKSHTRTKQGINFSFMETVDQFFENKDYENLLYYFDYKIFCLIIMIFMKNKIYKSKNLNEK